MGARFPGCRVTMGAPNHCGGAEWLRRVPKSPNNLTSTSFIKVPLLRKNLSFNMGAPNLLLASGAV